MSKLVSRNFIVEDIPNIVSLYNSITGRSRSIDQHIWEWCHNPSASFAKVIVESDTKKLIGHHGLLPIILSYRGTLISAGKTENTIVAPKYLGTGIYYLYEKKFFQEARQKFQLTYTTLASGTPKKIRKKLEYQCVGHHCSYIKLLGVSGYMNVLLMMLKKKRLFPIFFCLLGLTFFPVFFLWHCLRKSFFLRKTVEFFEVHELSSIKNELNIFWGENKKYFDVTIDRSYDFLDWRVVKNPYCKYRMLVARKHNKIVGYLILRTFAGSAGLKHGCIVDIVAHKQNFNVMSQLLDYALRFFEKLGCTFVKFDTIVGKNKLNTLFKKFGFLNERKVKKGLLRKDIPPTELLLNNFQNILPDKLIFNPDNWYYTDLFSEGVT